MFSSFQEADEFVGRVTSATQSGKVVWEERRDGFIERGGCNNPSFYLYSEDPPILILRGNGEDYDLVIDLLVDPNHADSLKELGAAVKKQVGVLF